MEVDMEASEVRSRLAMGVIAEGFMVMEADMEAILAGFRIRAALEETALRNTTNTTKVQRHLRPDGNQTLLRVRLERSQRKRNL